LIRVGGIGDAFADDDLVDEERAERLGGFVDDALVAEEFAQVAGDVGNGRRVGRAEIDEEDRAFGHAGRDWSRERAGCQTRAEGEEADRSVRGGGAKAWQGFRFR